MLSPGEGQGGRQLPVLLIDPLTFHSTTSQNFNIFRSPPPTKSCRCHYCFTDLITPASTTTAANRLIFKKSLQINLGDRKAIVHSSQ